MLTSTKPGTPASRTRQDGPPGPGKAWSRRQLLRSAAGSLALVAGGPVLLGDTDSHPIRKIDRFVSRPDLTPPSVRVTGDASADGFIFLAALLGPGQHGPMIVDQRGQLVWFRPVPGAATANFGVQTYRGQKVLAWWEGQQTGGHGVGEYVIADSSYRDICRVRAGHGLAGDLHEFIISPSDTALFSAYRAKRADLSAVGGPKNGTLLDSIVQEVDIATGSVLFEWAASEHVPLSESHAPYDGGDYDFFHLNSIDVGPDGNLLISARHTWTVYNISRPRGQILWRLGGKSSDFATSRGARFYWQHDARWQPDGTITVFDDGDGLTQDEPASRGIRIAADQKLRTAWLADSFVHPGYLADAMGSMQLLPGGGAFVGWGTVPAFTSFRPDATIGLDGYFPGGGISYRAFLQSWTGQPAGLPLVATARRGGQRYALASWNGATTVAAWRLNVGRAPAKLRQDRTIAASGFETAIPLSGSTGYLTVDALDAAGRQLASSAPIRW